MENGFNDLGAQCALGGDQSKPDLGGGVGLTNTGFCPKSIPGSFRLDATLRFTKWCLTPFLFLPITFFLLMWSADLMAIDYPYLGLNFNEIKTDGGCNIDIFGEILSVTNIETGHDEKPELKKTPGLHRVQYKINFDANSIKCKNHRLTENIKKQLIFKTGGMGSTEVVGSIDINLKVGKIYLLESPKLNMVEIREYDKMPLTDSTVLELYIELQFINEDMLDCTSKYPQSSKSYVDVYQNTAAARMSEKLGLNLIWQGKLKNYTSENTHDIKNEKSLINESCKELYFDTLDLVNSTLSNREDEFLMFFKRK